MKTKKKKNKKDKKDKSKKQTGLTEHWALCQFYEPFAMGGDVWQFRRYKVLAENVELIKKFKGFLFYNDGLKEWQVHEMESGGHLGSGKTKEDAIYQANNNIDITPNLHEQIKNLGDTTRFEVVEIEEAFRRLAKSKN